MQFTSKYRSRCFGTKGIFGEDRRAGKAKLVILLEFLMNIFLSLAELGAMCLVKNENNLLVVDR